MKLFEDAWTIKGKTYVREFNPQTQKSEKRLTPYKAEYYVKDNLGKYRGFLDQEPLRKVKGSAYDVDDAYGVKSGEYVAIREDYFGDGSKYNKNPRTWFLDIETSVNTQPGSTGFPHPEDALEPIVLIQFWDSTEKQGYVLGLEEWYKKDDYKYDFDIKYLKYDSEVELLNGFMQLFNDLDPFILYAWNGENFDFPYIFNRIKNIGLKNRLSNYGNAFLKTKKLDNGTIVHDVISPGHKFLDLMAIYKKFVFKNVPNYSLDTIGEIETGSRKVNHDNYIRFDDFRTGVYVITGNETEEQKKTTLYKAAKALEELNTKDTNNPKVHEAKGRLSRYIKEKSYSDFVDYGIRDFVLLKGIHDAQNFTQIMTTMAGQMGCLLEDTLGTLKSWECYITNYIAKDRLIAPPRVSQNDPFVIGGFVREPEKGKHNWILSADVTSMYPLLGMASFNMSPETFIPFDKRPKDLQKINELLNTQDEDKILAITDEEWEQIREVANKYNVSIGVGGAVFSKAKKGVIPTLVSNIYNGRKIAKKEMFKYEQEAIDLKEKGEDNTHALMMASMKNTEQMTEKIKINALYGALAAKHFSMFNEKIAQAITGAGRYFIKMLANNVEDTLQKMIPQEKPYILAGDTDSIYFHIEPFIDKYTSGMTITDKTKWADAFYKKIIEKVVATTIDRLALNLCAYDKSFIGADREVIADAGIFVAKKKYALRVRDNEGKVYPEDNPYLKVQGLEIIKGGTSSFAKKYLKEAVPVILDSTPEGVKKWFNEIRSKFLEWPLADIAYTQGVSKVHNPEWGTIKNGRKVSIPFGSRVCMVTNDYIIKNNLEETFSLIEAGDKVQILFLRQPNKLRSEAFAFTDPRFAEMFKDDIDYDTTFEKYFVSPLQGMLDAVGINLKHSVVELDAW